jgi:hypothetical protein
LAMLMLMLATTTAGCTEIQRVHAGDDAPAFSLKDIDGNTVGTDLFKGRIGILHLFPVDSGDAANQTTRDNIRSENLRTLRELAAIKANATFHGIAFLSVGIVAYRTPPYTQETADQAVRDLRNEVGVSWPVAAELRGDSVYGRDGTAYALYHPSGPNTYVIDEKGIVRIFDGGANIIDCLPPNLSKLLSGQLENVAC